MFIFDTGKQRKKINFISLYERNFRSALVWNKQLKIAEVQDIFSAKECVS
jgi:hypothetical protein